MQVIEEIVGDFGYGDIIYIQLVPLDEKQQQVKRAFKGGQIDAVDFFQGLKEISE